MNIQPLHDLGTMGFDCFDRQVEVARHLLAGQTTRHQTQNLGLAGGQGTFPRGLGTVCKSLRQLARYAGAQVDVATLHRRKRQSQLVDCRVFDQITSGARLNRFGDVLVVVIHGQQYHPGCRRLETNLAQCNQPAHARHGNVQQRDRGRQLKHQTHRLVAITGLGHHFNPGQALQQGAQAGAHQIVIVRQ